LVAAGKLKKVALIACMELPLYLRTPDTA
jgi:hypothetical protein